MSDAGASDRALEYANRPVREVVDEAWEQLDAFNDPPRLFVRGGQLVHLVEDDETVRVEQVNDDLLHNLLHSAADWTKNGGHATTIPKDIVRTIKGEPDKPLPDLDTVLRTPVFLDDGTLHTTPGYHAESGFFLHLPGEADIPEVPEDPTPADVQAAVELLQDKLQDFPFASATDEAHTFAMLLEPFVRPMVSGRTPLYLVEADKSGSGKTCLVNMCGLISVGREPPSMTEGESDQEWRKRITSTLLGAPRMVKIDNVNEHLDSGSLASALTSETWSDRRLGESETVEMPVNCTWTVTANNPTYSDEIGRRLVTIRLEPDHPNPRQRDLRTFEYPNLLNHVQEHRGELIGACLTLVQAWISEGQPEYQGAPLPSFGEWSRVMGGILQVAGLPGFLADRDRVEASIQDESAQFECLVETIHDEVGEDPWTVGEVFEAPKVEAVAKQFVGKQDTSAAKQSLGKRLANQNGTTCSGLRLEKAGRDRHRKVNQYQLQEIDSPNTTAGGAGSAGNREALASNDDTTTTQHRSESDDDLHNPSQNPTNTTTDEDTTTNSPGNPANPATPASGMSTTERIVKSLKGVFTLHSDD